MLPALPMLSSPRISRPGFAQILRRYAAPLPAAEVAQAYMHFEAWRIDPCVALAFGYKEHSLRWAGVAGRTKGWGNIISAALTCVRDSRSTGSDGRFARYATYADGAYDFAAYLRCRFLDRGITDLETLIAAYAPKGDGDNDPAAYAATVRRMVGLWQDQEPAPADPWAAWGDACPLPAEQRSYAIPQAWLRREAGGTSLGAAISDELHDPAAGLAVRVFQRGVIVWYADSNQTRIYE